MRVFRDARGHSPEIRCPGRFPPRFVRGRGGTLTHGRRRRKGPAPEWRGHVRLVGFAAVTRLIGLFTGLLAVSAVSAQVHVPSSAASPGFLASRGVPAIWLPELDAGIPMSGARVFVPGIVDAGRGVPLAFALDGGPIPLTINVDLTYHDTHADSSTGWVPFTHMAVAYGLGVGGAVRNVASPGAYRFFVYDGDARLDDVTQGSRLGSDQATTFEPGPLIYAAYVKKT